MRNMISLLCLLVLAISGMAEKSDQKNVSSINIIKPRIVGGKRLSILERPFMLSLHHRSEGFQCGAFIISAEWGITAQHCFKFMDASAYSVRAGSDHFFKGGTVHRVTEIVVYDPTLFENTVVPISDIALFKVRPLFKFSNSVQPAKLPIEGTNPNPKTLVVSGWGSLNQLAPIMIKSGRSEAPVYLMAVRLPYVPFEQCWKIYPTTLNKDLHTCYGGGVTDACKGDSGGPIGDRTTVYGIVSFSKGCGMSGIPSVYTRLSTFRRWIKEITNV